MQTRGEEPLRSQTAPSATDRPTDRRPAAGPQPPPPPASDQAFSHAERAPPGDLPPRPRPGALLPCAPEAERRAQQLTPLLLPPGSAAQPAPTLAHLTAPQGTAPLTGQRTRPGGGGGKTRPPSQRGSSGQGGPGWTENRRPSPKLPRGRVRL